MIDDQVGIKVVCEIDGFVEHAYVDSVELIDSKREQMKEAIKRRAFNAFIEHKASNK